MINFAYMVKRIIFAAVAYLALAGSCAFAQKNADAPMVFVPQWTPQAQFAGYYVALEKGFYDEEGINVRIEHPTTTLSAMDLMKNGEAQITTLQLTQALEEIDDGTPMVNILQTSMNNGLVIVSRRNMNPMDQKGSRVGIWSVGFGQMAICMSNMENLDYQWIPFAGNVNLFLVGALDATLAMSYNEYYQILQSGFKIDYNHVYRFSEHGYNVQEDGVWMRTDVYKNNTDKAQAFARASRKGWEWAAEHEEETLDIVMDYCKRYNMGTNRIMQKLMLEEILRLQLDRESGNREFRLRPDMVETASSLLYDNGMTNRLFTIDDLLAK